jgi:hypothetical protein
MPMPTDHAQLSALFAQLGARDPGGWASSQVSEEINPLHRFLFLKKAGEPRSRTILLLPMRFEQLSGLRVLRVAARLDGRLL